MEEGDRGVQRKMEQRREEKEENKEFTSWRSYVFSLGAVASMQHKGKRNGRREKRGRSTLQMEKLSRTIITFKSLKSNSNHQ